MKILGKLLGIIFFSCLKADGRYQELVSVLPKRKRNKSDGKYIWDYRQTSD